MQMWRGGNPAARIALQRAGIHSTCENKNTGSFNWSVFACAIILLAIASHWRFPTIGRELNFEPRYSGTKRWTPRATSRSGDLERWKRDPGISQYNTRDP